MEEMNQNSVNNQSQRKSSGDYENRYPQRKSSDQCSTEKIQKFLYEQIFQQGYDGEEFRAFLKSKYPQIEEDQNNISMDQIKEVVSAFKLQAQQGQIRMDSNSEKVQNDYSKKEYLTFDGPNQKMIQSNYRNSQQISSSIIVDTRKRQTSAYLNEKYANPTQYAINKEILKEPPINQKPQQQQNQQHLAQTNVVQSVYIQGQPYQSQQSVNQLGPQQKNSDQIEDTTNQSILNSIFSQSRVIKDDQGQTIVRKEAQIVPVTSLVKDNFVKRNLEGEETSKIISCKTMEPSKISEFLKTQQNELRAYQNLKVIIDKYDIAVDGIFSLEYALYNVQTPVFEWCVQRRFNDFYWLYNILKKQYPGTFIPPIPKKTAIKEMNNQHLYHRMRSFEYFLNELLFCPQLSVSPIVSDFLSCADQKAFEALRKEYDLKTVPHIVDLISTVKGELNSEVTPALKEFWLQFSDLNSKSLLQYENINESIDSMMNHLKKAGEESSKIAHGFSHISKSHEQFNRLSHIGKNQTLENLNSFLNTYFVDFSNTLFDIVQVIQKNFYEFTRFQKAMHEEMKQTSNFQNDFQTTYLEHLKKLNQKKDKLFQSSNTAKWELDAQCLLTVRELQANKVEALKCMLPTETKLVQNQGDLFGYINKALYEDVCMHQAYCKDLMCNHFIALSKDIALELNKFHINTAESNMQFAELLGQRSSSLNSRYRPE